VTDAPPIPSPELAARIGGAYEDYEDIGRQQRAVLEAHLPAGWSFDGKRMLDFGCGTGRTLSAFLPEAGRAEFVGCDIHEESIAWARSQLSPPLHFFVCSESPPLEQPDESFDLVYAMSVFTHITDQWSNWLTELHRVMRPQAIAVISVLGPAIAKRILGTDWDDRIGMVTVDLHQDWTIGGPNVLLGDWWVREHWSRAFEILGFDHRDPAAGEGHDFVVIRKREVNITPEMLETVDPADPREFASLSFNLELLWRQQRVLGDQLREAQRLRTAAELETGRSREVRPVTAEVERLSNEVLRQRAEIERLQALLDTVINGHSWRLTAPLRRAREMVGRRR
jgi:SAM-dependent methyltransferase